MNILNKQFFKLIRASGLLNFIPDRVYLKAKYKRMMGEKLNLKEPKTHQEKMQWLKLNYRDPLMTQCADKYSVRSYVKNCGLEHLLVPLYGVYENAGDIDFATLPESFYLKCTHYSGGNALIKNKNDIDSNIVKKNLNRKLKFNYYYQSREWPYKNIKPRIVCEKYLESSESNPLVDMNFFCFNGKPEFIFYNVGLSDNEGNHAVGKRAVLDVNFNYIDDINTSQHKLSKDKVVKPDGFEEMIEYAKILSKPFPNCRVDFFCIDGETYFGEITFYSAGGFMQLSPEKWNKKLSDLIVLPNKH